MVDRYDAGQLNDYGGGDVDWWWDYMRAEIDRANEFHADIHDQNEAALAAKDAEIEEIRNQLVRMVDIAEGRLFEISRLEDALGPFAAVAENDIGEDETDQDLFRPMDRHNRAPRLTVGDLRAAQAALAGGSDAP